MGYCTTTSLSPNSQRSTGMDQPNGMNMLSRGEARRWTENAINIFVKKYLICVFFIMYFYNGPHIYHRPHLIFLAHFYRNMPNPVSLVSCKCRISGLIRHLSDAGLMDWSDICHYLSSVSICHYLSSVSICQYLTFLSI